MTTPFTTRLVAIKEAQRLRYVDLEQRAGRARSTAWFNILINQGAWAVGPPPKDTWDDLARLLETTPEHVRQMVAEEWFGVRSSDEVSRWVTSLAPGLDKLDDGDQRLVEALIQRLGRAAQDALARSK